MIVKSTVLLIRAGEIGISCLQGLVKNRDELEIHILDPSESALDLARTRSSGVTYDKSSITLRYYLQGLSLIHI